MKTVEVPFSMSARVGDVEIEEVVSGTISVNLYDDPKDDEINAVKGETEAETRCLHIILGKLSHAKLDEIERAAINKEGGAQ